MIFTYSYDKTSPVLVIGVKRRAGVRTPYYELQGMTKALHRLGLI